MQDKKLLAITLILLFGFTLIVQWPGTIYWDSFVQYQEALNGEYTDWHPPVMAVLWRCLIMITGSAGSMMALNLMVLMMAFYLLCRDMRWFVAVPLVTVLFFNPIFFGNIGIPWKDVQLAVIVIFTAAIQISCATRNLKPSNALITAMFVILIYGSFLRANAPFITAPLIISVFGLWKPISIWTITSGLLAALLILLTPLVNHKLIGAKPMFAVHSLQVFDIGGVSHNIQENLFPGNFSDTEIQKIKSECYSPYLWNDYAWGKCSFVYDNVNKEQLSSAWKKALIGNPSAYLSHRLEYFNNFIRFIGPFYPDWYYLPKLPGIESDSEVRDNYFMEKYLSFEENYPRQPWFIPFIWLSIAIGFFIASCTGSNERLNSVLNGLSFAAIAYVAGYALIGVASDVRYVFPSAYLTVASLICAIGYWRQIGTPGSRMAGLLVTISIIAVGAIF